MQSQTYKKVHIQKLQYRPFDLHQVDMRRSWSKGTHKLLTYEETCQANQYAKFNNGVFSAFLHAYNQHGDVKITPDDIWLTIMLYFSKYVNDNAEQLRSAFVSHQGKKKLTVTTQNQLSESQWDQFFTLMIEQIKKNTAKGVTQKFQCTFSTTQRIQRVFSTAVIMNTYKKYFQYGRCIPLCGINNVHFGGTLSDWKLVLQKTTALAEYDVNGKLKKYVKNVAEILRKFIETYEGKVDVDFWNKIVNEEKGPKGSGRTTYIDGWLIQLFGYSHRTEEVQLDSIDVDIIIDNHITGITKTVKLVGGFRAVHQEGNIFRPHLSMAILDLAKKESEKEKMAEMGIVIDCSSFKAESKQGKSSRALLKMEKFDPEASKEEKEKGKKREQEKEKITKEKGKQKEEEKEKKQCQIF